MTLKIDHFTLGANDLDHATAYLEALTGAGVGAAAGAAASGGFYTARVCPSMSEVLN